MNASELANVVNVLKTTDENAIGNSEDIELQWAIKAFHHAETYFNLITAVDPKLLKLSPHDDIIYAKFKADFPDLKVEVITDDLIKSDEAKPKWREFCEAFDPNANDVVIVKDYNTGTLLRLDASQDISEDNTTLVPRIQFLAIEIARNREGINSELRNKFKPKKIEEAPTVKSNVLSSLTEQFS